MKKLFFIIIVSILIGCGENSGGSGDGGYIPTKLSLIEFID